MRVVVIGASGQLGTALVSAFEDRHTVIPTAHRHAAPQQRCLDLADPVTVGSTLTELAPDLVLLAGAMCNVDGCEREPDTCFQVNVAGTRAVAEHLRERGGAIVLYSTDHVFDGHKETFVEEDGVNPFNVYSRSKVLAEDVVRQLLPDRHLILRTGWVYGPDSQRRNFILRFVDRVAGGETVRVPSDQWGSPTHTGDLAEVTRFLIEQGRGGTFHATGPDYINRVTLARLACAAFDLTADGVIPVSTSELDQAARRPLQVRLDCGKLALTGAPPLRGIEAGLRELAEWKMALPGIEHSRRR